jgi:SET domain
MIDQRLIEFKRKKMVRSVDWLEKHGVCADNMYFGVSTIPQAGHGAFAIRPLAKNEVVLPVPLIHIPNREILEYYEFLPSDRTNGHPTLNTTTIAGHQLLLNYCLGHRDSTMVLSPYGPVFNTINHNQTLANVKLQWALPERSNHHPEMLEKGVSHFDKLSSSVLAMELIALRDIQSGEEIFLDYGDEWEAAWQNHIANFVPIDGAATYVAAWQLNDSTETLRTEFEAIENPYPDNVVLKMNLAFANQSLKKRNTKITEAMMSDYDYVECEILRRRKGEEQGEYLYAVFSSSHGDYMVEDVPRFGFKFEDQPGTTDIFNSNAFRHDIRIPDELFPKTWKNKIQNVDVSV